MKLKHYIAAYALAGAVILMTGCTAWMIHTVQVEMRSRTMQTPPAVLSYKYETQDHGFQTVETPQEEGEEDPVFVRRHRQRVELSWKDFPPKR